MSVDKEAHGRLRSCGPREAHQGTQCSEQKAMKGGLMGIDEVKQGTEPDEEDGGGWHWPPY